MKKNLFLLGLAVAAMTSCTNDEVLEQNQSTQKAIGFETFVNKGTRAIGETTSPNLSDNNTVTGLSKFYVHGYHDNNIVDFNSAIVTGTYDENLNTAPKIKWTHDGDTKYWANADYYFAAYAFSNKDNTKNDKISFSNRTLKIEDYEVQYNDCEKNADGNVTQPTTSDASDLVAAVKYETGTINRSQTVNFTFKHLLSKIKLYVYNNNNQGLTIDITDVKISNVSNKGTFNYLLGEKSNNWNPAQTNWTIDYDGKMTDFIAIKNQTLAAKVIDANNAVISKGEDYSADFYVLPHKLKPEGGNEPQISFTANYKQSDGSIVETENVVLKFYTETIIGETTTYEHTTWEPGFYYIYSIGLPKSATPITFGTPTVGSWPTAETITLK